MNRVYINGVHNINFDGKKLSFSLTDTFQKNSGEIVRNEIFNCLTDLEVAEEICNFLIGEIEKIKNLNSNSRKNTFKKTQPQTKKSKPPVGKRILPVDFSHK